MRLKMKVKPISQRPCVTLKKYKYSTRGEKIRLEINQKCLMWSTFLRQVKLMAMNNTKEVDNLAKNWKILVIDL